MWCYLRNEYYRDNAYSLVFQVSTLFIIVNDQSVLLSKLVQKFESGWLQLSKPAKASIDEHHQIFAKSNDQDKAKCEFLQWYLARHHKNIIKHLTWKDGLTFADIELHLLHMESIKNPPNSALARKSSKDKERKSFPPRVPKSNHSSGQKGCTCCSKEYLGHSKEHYWNQFSKLKEHNDREKVKPGQENTWVTNSNCENIRAQSFFSDSCATSHMCPCPDLVENLSLCTGLVTSSFRKTITVKRTGTVILDIKIPDGSVSFFSMSD